MHTQVAEFDKKAKLRATNDYIFNAVGTLVSFVVELPSKETRVVLLFPLRA